jgi:murein DD-endopeptidase MepM/ murein hydrolase activator NlpD
VDKVVDAATHKPRPHTAQPRPIQARPPQPRSAEPRATQPHAEPVDTVEDDDDDGTLQREAAHIVKPGETLDGVANRGHVPRVLIIEANGLKAPYTLHGGQHLRLPRTRHHTVAKGESGFDIAYHYGVAWSAIATANGLEPSAAVEPGEKLLIPILIKAKSAPRSADSRTDADAATTPAVAPVAIASGASAPADSDARFVWPVGGKVVRRFVARGNADYHDGIDIAGKQGSPVRASAGGEVLFAGEEPQSFGRLVVIDHKNGWQTAYGFLGKITVAQGDKVRAGERIGLVGHSGKAKRDELHFELRKANRPVDPVPQLPDLPRD